METVAAILEAAALILEREGYSAATTNAIAERAGVSIGSLYQYFTSREDIFRALLKRHESEFHPLVEKFGAGLLAEDADPSHLLVELLGDILAVHATRPGLMLALEVELDPIRPPDESAREERLLELGTRMIAARLPGPSEAALANAWLAMVLFSSVSRKWAHTPPSWVDLEGVKAGFAKAVRALLAPESV
jgi:AcrR family transcriptional regulator